MKFEYSHLVEDVQKKAVIPVKGVRDVKLLKEDIESVTGLTISYNTLRRLFGFLERTTPSLITLNILSQYLGFKSYANYLNNKSNFDDWYFYQKLLHMQTSGNISADQVKLLNIGLLNTLNIAPIASFIGSVVDRYDVKSLSVIFSGLALDKVPEGPQMKLGTILSHAFLRISRETALALYKELLPIDSFRNMVPLTYIDYSNLNTLYGDVVILIRALNSNVSDVFFTNLILEYRHFFNGSGFQNKEIQLPKNSNSLHHVLLGRYYGYKIMASETRDPVLLKEILRQCKQRNMTHFSQELFLALILKNEMNTLATILDLYYEELLESDRWNAKTTTAITLISLANLNVFTNDLKPARRNLEIVELEKAEMSYHNYLGLFYHFTYLKISFAENNKKENASSLVELHRLITLTGFNYFKTISIPFILKSSAPKN
jgi:hypothetical protein